MASRKKKKSNKAAYLRRKQDRDIAILIGAVILLLAVVFGSKSVSLLQRLHTYQEKEAYYNNLIKEETQRKEDLVEFEKYTKTTKYVEEIAQKNFGLVKDGEILFIAED